VHRLAVFLGSGSDKIVIVDTTDHTVVTSFSRTIMTAPGDGVDPPYTLGFANQGSLALIPTGDDQLTWVDLTSVDGPAEPVNGTIALNDPNDTGLRTTIGVAVSPDSGLAVVADETIGRLWALTIDELFPSYSSPISHAPTRSLRTPPNSGPRCPTFVSNRTLVVPYKLAGDLAVFERDGDVLSNPDLTVPAGNRPAHVAFVPQRATLLSASQFDFTLSAFLVAGTSVTNPGDVGLVVNNLRAFAVDPTGSFAYTVSANSYTLGSVLLADRDLFSVGQSEGQLSSNQARSIAADPVGGKYVYVGLYNELFPSVSVDIFDVVGGGTLSRRATNPLHGDSDFDRCFGIGIQP
jgi:hypothetical protein